ncbi:MAG: thermonuclease family protein [Cyanobacteria bacterium K_Offshore_surface_m2_239]|nr:thermonuclease family protein [Cyanobacteria bacterium K_Offshore_surface_m2_239]
MSLRPQTIDRYGRTVAEVIRSGRNVNLELVRTGQAFVYEQYIAQCDATACRQTQSVAKGQGARGGRRAAQAGVCRDRGDTPLLSWHPREREEQAVDKGGRLLAPAPQAGSIAEN